MNEKEIKKDMATTSEGIQYETLLCEIPKNPNSVWTIDLKRAEIKHGDIGQMNLYLNYFKNEICQLK